MMTNLGCASLLLYFSLFASAQTSFQPKKQIVPSSESIARAKDWATPAEISNYRTTPRYDETMAYIQRVQKAAPKHVKIEVFGKSGEGRDLIAVIASKDAVFDPAALHAANRPIILLQNSIHAGEMDGKDACLALLRDMVITKSQAKLLDQAVVIILPIYNADGHERFGAFNRINQNGPEQMGWRTTGVNLNLNRDYMKADAVETRAFLRLWSRWLPDFYVDNHVTDGADYRYDTTYEISSGPDVFPALAKWIQHSLIPYTENSVNATGHIIGPYLGLIDDTDPSKGVAIAQDLPRFSTGFAVLENRAGLLVEMHMLKDYKTRVTGNYEIMRAMLEVINRDATELVQANRDADSAAISAGRTPGSKLPLLLAPTGNTESFAFKGFKFDRSLSEVSGATRVAYTNVPLNITIPRQSELALTRAVAIPAAYIIPAPWTAVTDVLNAHGLSLKKTTKPWTSEVEVYRCPQPKWTEKPFEGRHLASFDSNGPATDNPVAAASSSALVCRLVREKQSYPVGSVVVPLAQRAAKIAIHFLEPEAPDSAVNWGFFDTIFEQKEYAEGYVLEKLAREMLVKDPKLKEEFETRIANDREFAASPSARLNFFYERSPWWDSTIGLYPVGRLSSLDGVPVN